MVKSANNYKDRATQQEARRISKAEGINYTTALRRILKAREDDEIENG